jgi:thioredoxin reductase
VIGHDGTPPQRLAELAREQASSYPGITLAASPVSSISGKPDEFEIALADGRVFQARRVLLATGIADDLPPIEGLRPLWGRTVVHCPYCHGWELRGGPLTVLILGRADVFNALKLTHLGSGVTALLNGAPEPPPPLQQLLRAAGITVRHEPIARLVADRDQLREVVFADGTSLPTTGLFVHPPARQAAGFAASLGCDLLPDGTVAVDDLGRTSVPGVYAAGDMARRAAMPIPGHLVSVAAAAGALSAMATDNELMFADMGVPLPIPWPESGSLTGGSVSG